MALSRLSVVPSRALSGHGKPRVSKPTAGRRIFQRNAQLPGSRVHTPVPTQTGPLCAFTKLVARLPYVAARQPGGVADTGLPLVPPPPHRGATGVPFERPGSRDPRTSGGGFRSVATGGHSSGGPPVAPGRAPDSRRHEPGGRYAYPTADGALGLARGKPGHGSYSSSPEFFQGHVYCGSGIADSDLS
ncbi:hypothetical protein KM043_013142 [Ampulex compressa]|nr:hypothetical protein KM043_013142 [Ampulex compressa]